MAGRLGMMARKWPIVLGYLSIVTLAVGYALWPYLTPFAIFCFSLIVSIIVIALRLPRARLFLYNFAAVVAAIGLFELYLTAWPTAEAHHEGTYTKDYFSADPQLGYAIAPGPRIVDSVLRAPDGSAIYDVKYTIDQFGLRHASPNTRATKSDKAVFFFGDSFTFGEGVNDEDTLPHQFSTASGIQAVNFGTHGYGPHQILRELETDRPRAVHARDPLAIVYVILPLAGMYRAAGRAEWDQNGPSYELIDGVLKYIGHFESYKSAILYKILSASRIYTQLLDAKIRMTATSTDRERMLAIVTRIRDLSLSQYHAPFFVVLWDVNRAADANATWLREKLGDRGIPALVLSVAAPQLQSDKYYIPVDAHPNRAGFALVASALNAFLEKNLWPSAQR